MQSLRLLWALIAAMVPLTMMALWLTPSDKDVHATTKAGRPAIIQPQVTVNPANSVGGQQAVAAPKADADALPAQAGAATPLAPVAGDQTPNPASSTGDQALPQVSPQGMASGQNSPSSGQSQ